MMSAKSSGKAYSGRQTSGRDRGTLAWDRRAFVLRLAAIVSGLAITRTAFGALARGGEVQAASSEGISHAGEAIHQEVGFTASPMRVYEALTDAKQFDQVVRLSAAVKSGMALGNKPTEISREAGGAFALFGGHIVGRQIELVPGERIVQAWRTVDWKPGVYSIAKFELAEQGSGTRLIFDHAAFPAGQGRHLAEGWRRNYWEPLGKYLA
jgi:uncharacterized protein YndB with AHSA1/START domain